MRLVVEGVVSGVLEGGFILLTGPPASGKTLVVEALWALLARPVIKPLGVRSARLEIGGVTLEWSGGVSAGEAGVRYVVIGEGPLDDYYFTGCVGAAGALPSNIGRILSFVEAGEPRCSPSTAWLRLLSVAVRALSLARGRAKLLAVDGLGRLPWAKRAETALILTAVKSGVEVLATIDDPIQARIIARHATTKPRIYVIESGRIVEADDEKLEELILRL